MKARKATQVNGKASSDSSKSDSGDDVRSVDETKDAEAVKPSGEAEKVAKLSTAPKSEKDVEQNKPEPRKGGSMNGPSRRGDYDHRGWSGRPYRDRNPDFRGGRGRDRPFNGDRGSWEYRGRGFRGRRGYRGYYGGGGGRPMPNNHGPAER